MSSMCRRTKKDHTLTEGANFEAEGSDGGGNSKEDRAGFSKEKGSQRGLMGKVRVGDEDGE